MQLSWNVTARCSSTDCTESDWSTLKHHILWLVLQFLVAVLIMMTCTLTRSPNTLTNPETQLWSEGVAVFKGESAPINTVVTGGLTIANTERWWCKDSWEQILKCSWDYCLDVFCFAVFCTCSECCCCILLWFVVWYWFGIDIDFTLCHHGWV